MSLHTFHGNFFVRSTDLLSLPCVNPDLGYTINISIDDNLKEFASVCFQAALLYTSSRGRFMCLVTLYPLFVCSVCVIGDPLPIDVLYIVFVLLMTFTHLSMLCDDDLHLIRTEMLHATCFMKFLCCR